MSVSVTQGDMQNELRYLATLPVGDGGHPLDRLKASARRAGVPVHVLQERLRGARA